MNTQQIPSQPPTAPVPQGGPAGAATLTAPASAPVDPAAERRARRESRVDESRPFGAHLRMAWWRALLVIISLLIVMFVGQVILIIIAGMIDIFAFDRDPMSGGLSPTMMLAANISLALLIPAALAAMVWIGGVPLRSVLRAVSRPRGHRLGIYLLAFAAIVAVGVGAMSLIEPMPMNIVMNGSTIAFLLVALFSTPFQAMGEEVMFRGAVMPAIASWIRPAKAALIVGLILSSIIFGLVHGATDLWLLGYYTIFGVCMALMAVISKGLEAPIAFHVVNNVMLMVIGAIGGGGEDLVIDRSAGAGGPWILLFVAVDIAAVALVWAWERRLAARTSTHEVAAQERPAEVSASGTAS